MGLTQGYGPVPEDQAVVTVCAALDAGVSLFDTAQSYGQGANERLLARALGRAGQVATKVGIVRTADGVAVDAAPERLRGYCEASLDGSAATSSTCTTCTASTPAIRSRNRWARSPRSWTPGWSATSACPR